MAKNKTEIHVTTVFDGELDATDVFVSLISQKYSKTNTKEYLAKKKDMKYIMVSKLQIALLSQLQHFQIDIYQTDFYQIKQLI